jgi:hypothetical protein
MPDMTKQDLLITALGADPETVVEVSDSRFALTGMNEAGNLATKGEYHVWTDGEAKSFGYERGGIPTSDPKYTVFRIF